MRRFALTLAALAALATGAQAAPKQTTMPAEFVGQWCMSPAVAGEKSKPSRYNAGPCAANEGGAAATMNVTAHGYSVDQLKCALIDGRRAGYDFVAAFRCVGYGNQKSTDHEAFTIEHGSLYVDVRP